MLEKSGTVEVNFGKKPFVYAIDQHKFPEADAIRTKYEYHWDANGTFIVDDENKTGAPSSSLAAPLPPVEFVSFANAKFNPHAFKLAPTIDNNKMTITFKPYCTFQTSVIFTNGMMPLSF